MARAPWVLFCQSVAKGIAALHARPHNDHVPDDRSPYLRLAYEALKLAARPLIAALAIVYFLLDALVLSFVHPLAKHLGSLRVSLWVAEQIRKLGPYPTLGLFLIPVLVLEPVKPIGLYLIGTKRVLAGALLIGLGELLKIFLLERLFQMSKPKLMSIPAFAWTYGYVTAWMHYFESLPPWQAARRISLRIKALFRGYDSADPQ